MINPYQAPPDPVGPEQESAGVAAEFQLTQTDIRHAEAKFLLHGYGGRLSLASLVMIALSILVAFDWPFLALTGRSTSGVTVIEDAPSLFFRELAVMLLATVVYLALIQRATKRIRERCRAQGVADGESVSARIEDQSLCWSTSKGMFYAPCKDLRYLSTSRGLILPIAKDLFWFIPKNAYFSVANYRDFVKRLKQRGRDAVDVEQSSSSS